MIEIIVSILLVIFVLPMIWIAYYNLFHLYKDLHEENKLLKTEDKRLKLAQEAYESGSYDRETIEYIFPELRK